MIDKYFGLDTVEEIIEAMVRDFCLCIGIISFNLRTLDRLGLGVWSSSKLLC